MKSVVLHRLSQPLHGQGLASGCSETREYEGESWDEVSVLLFSSDRRPLALVYTIFLLGRVGSSVDGCTRVGCNERTSWYPIYQYSGVKSYQTIGRFRLTMLTSHTKITTINKTRIFIMINLFQSFMSFPLLAGIK